MQAPYTFVRDIFRLLLDFFENKEHELVFLSKVLGIWYSSCLFGKAVSLVRIHAL